MMNTRFSYNLLQVFTKKRPAGFALPLVVMTGTVILVVGAAMMVKGTNDRNQVVSQKAKMVANSAAETGIARVQKFLLANPILAEYKMSEWKEMVNNPTDTAPGYLDEDGNTMTWGEVMAEEVVPKAQQMSCTYAAKDAAQAKTAMTQAMTAFINGAGAGEDLPSAGGSGATSESYQVANYAHDPGTGRGKVHVKGLVKDPSDNVVGQTDVITELPVTTIQEALPTPDFPGLWVKTGLNTGKVNADIAYDCAMNAGVATKDASKSDIYKKDKDAPDLVTYEYTATGISAWIPNDKTIAESSVPMPDAPDLPTTNVYTLAWIDIPEEVVASLPDNNQIVASLSTANKYSSLVLGSLWKFTQQTFDVALDFWIGNPALAKKPTADDTTEDDTTEKVNNGQDKKNGTGDAGAETGDAGAETGDAGAETGDAGAETGDAGNETGDAGNETGDAGNETGDAGAETGDAEKVTGQDKKDDDSGKKSAARLLPRPGDTPNADGVYQYIITDDIVGDLTIDSDYKVAIYLQGDIVMNGGQDRIKYDCSASSRTDCSAADMMIIGKKADGVIQFKGNPSVCDVFIWAPTYAVTINGGGQAQGCGGGPNNNGIYWVKSFSGGGTGAHIAMEQTTTTNYDDLKPVGALPKAIKMGATSKFITMGGPQADTESASW